MDASFLNALRSERDVLHKKICAIDALLSAYGDVFGIMKPNIAQPQVPQPRQQQSARAPSEKTLEIRRLVREFIAPNGDMPTPTRALVEHLRKNGIEVGGKNEVATLSATLSNGDGFRAIGRSGWVYSDHKEAESAFTEVGNENGEPQGSPEVGAEGSSTPYGVLG